MLHCNLLGTFRNLYTRILFRIPHKCRNSSHTPQRLDNLCHTPLPQLTIHPPPPHPQYTYPVHVLNDRSLTYWQCYIRGLQCTWRHRVYTVHTVGKLKLAGFNTPFLLHNPLPLCYNYKGNKQY